MRIDPDLCVACGNCLAVCPVGAIRIDPALRRAVIDREQCVECFTCYRGMSREHMNPRLVRGIRRGLALLRLRFDPEPDVCPTSAIVPEELAWPRTLRRAFSDVQATHASTGILGRGTEEVKTNDVTDRLKEGELGFVVELGRPSVGVWFRDIERVTRALAAVGVAFEAENPITHLMVDRATGELQPDVMGERVLSGIVEFRIPPEKAMDMLALLRRIADDLDTVMSIGLAARCDGMGANEAEAIMAAAGLPVLRAKTNLGLGRRDAPGPAVGAEAR
ncbi:MAG TPA: 4Fe-4S binding protein [Longimicrobiales bacterium]|nr:4Fe-4S binding protein [Longimicrobiales bacterium]